MIRLFRLAIAMLPLALGAAVAGAQEPPRPVEQEVGPRSTGPRAIRPREPMPQRRREAPPMTQQGAAPEPPRQMVQAQGQGQDSRSMSDAVRRVQRSTGGQILGAEQVPFEGRSITRVKYMDERGRVRYMDDPGSGRRGVTPRRADNDER